MSKRTEVRAVVTVAPGRPFFRPSTFGGVHCRLADDAAVRFYSADFCVTVESESLQLAVSSSERGFVEFTDPLTRRRHHVRTGPLYLAAAERQGIPVEVVEGGGCWSDLG